MTAMDSNPTPAEPATACEVAPHDAALYSAIVRAAGTLPFNCRPGSLQRQCTIGLFVAALSDRITLDFPRSADALHEIVFGAARVDASKLGQDPLR